MIAKKMLTFLTISLFIGLTVLPAIDGRATNTKNIITFFKDKSEIKIQSLGASSPYDYGWKAGRLLRSQYKLIDIFARFTKINNIKKQDIKDQIDYMKQHYPFFLEELKGLSASTNIKLERLLFLKNFLRSIGGSCTTMLVTGPATKYNETFLINNIDCSIATVKKALRVPINHLFISRKIWVKDISYSKLDYKYLYRGIPILWEFPIMNEKGLSFGDTGTVPTKNESRYIDRGPGIDMDMLRTLTMFTCKNVSEVARLWKSLERLSEISPDREHINDVTAWCDGEGGILIIEETYNHILTVFGNSTEITNASEGILWHANHHQWLDPNLTGSVFPSEYPSSGLRAERAHELLEENYGNITLDVCKEMAGDHGGGFDKNGKDSGDICRHPDENQMIVTSYSFIINPKEFTIYVSHRSPCKGIYRQYDLSKKFEK